MTTFCISFYESYLSTPFPFRVLQAFDWRGDKKTKKRFFCVSVLVLKIVSFFFVYLWLPFCKGPDNVTLAITDK
jgi:hypothetical protein